LITVEKRREFENENVNKLAGKLSREERKKIGAA
jgi:hypothetical protein